MKLNELAHFLSGQLIWNGKETPPEGFDEDHLFCGFTSDSRYVRPGNIFIAVPGDRVQDHVRAALKAGATALVVEESFAQSLQDKVNVPLISVVSPRRALARIAAMLYPGQPKVNVAVTGTNGKSSVVTFVRQIWQHLRFSAASIGTLGVELTPDVYLKDQLPPTKLTTPDAFAFHQILQCLAVSEVTHCVFEASSHGLDQYRSHEVELTAAGFTNLTQDHLDYHGTMDAYFDAKARLFWEVLPSGQSAVLNAGSSYYTALQALCLGRGQNVMSYGINREADLRADNLRHSSDKISFDLTIGAQSWKDISVNLVGEFQLENVLCAMGLAIASRATAAAVVETLPHLRSAPGRMELVGKTEEGSAVFIDYAHTPDALGRALQALRTHVTANGRLIVVFGCGGNRDAGKRAQMGGTAHSMADHVYVTDDNPRSEDPAFIRAQVLAACPDGHEIADRGQAIKTAIGRMQPDDILLVAGKGHEQGQIIGDSVVAFDDRIEAQKHLKSLREGGKPVKA